MQRDEYLIRVKEVNTIYLHRLKLLKDDYDAIVTLFLNKYDHIINEQILCSTYETLAAVKKSDVTISAWHHLLHSVSIILHVTEQHEQRIRTTWNNELEKVYAAYKK